MRLVPPLGYLDFLALQAGASAVLTDSGGVQEETTVLGVPCFTLRNNTERPITLTEGTAWFSVHSRRRASAIFRVEMPSTTMTVASATPAMPTT